MAGRRSRSGKERPWQTALRWTAGSLAMAATWAYGVWKGGTVLWLTLAIGPLVMVCLAAALTIPLITIALATAAFLYGLEAGLVPALRNLAASIVMIGLALTGWRVATSLRERDRRP